MKPETVSRIYNGSDALMTQSARVTYDLCLLELASFTNFDSALNPAFLALYLEKLQNAETIVSDSTIKSRQIAINENVLDIMDVARAKYKEVKYFAQKAFPESYGTQYEFGFNDYAKARRSKIMLGNFLFNLHRACTKYKIPLITAGYNQARIDDILPLRAELIQENSGHKTYQEQRPKLTEDRITVLNNCYAAMVSVMAAAQMVYATDYAKQHQFVYWPSGKKKDGD